MHARRIDIEKYDGEKCGFGRKDGHMAAAVKNGYSHDTQLSQEPTLLVRARELIDRLQQKGAGRWQMGKGGRGMYVEN